MENLMAFLSDLVPVAGFSLVLGAMIFVLLKVFAKAVSYKTTGVLGHDSDIYSFDFSESHRLLMEREDIVQMTQQGYYDPMDQVFSLEKWKQKVAHYMHQYDCYISERGR